MSAPSSPLYQRLLQLQSRFTWDLKEEDMDLDSLSTRLTEHIDLNLGRKGAQARSYGFLAYVRYLQNRPEDALSLLVQSEEETRECFGEDSERRLLVTYGDLAWLKYESGDFPESERYCRGAEEILVKFPTASPADLHPEVYGEKGWSYLKFSRDYYGNALRCFQRALELQPDDSEWNAGCAIALYRLEARPKSSEDVESSPAVAQLRRALQVNPEDAVLLSMLALKLLDFKRHREAEGLVERALKVDPDNPHVIRYVGKYLRIQGEDERSIKLLKEALERSSQSAFIHHQLATCYKKQLNAAKSQRPFRPQNLSQWRSLSMKHLEHAVRIKPSFVIAITDLALLHAEDGNLSRAEDLFTRALQGLDSDKSVCQVFFLRYADFHLYHRKQEAEAVTHYSKVLTFTRGSYEWNQSVKKLQRIADRRLSADENDGAAHALRGQVARAEGNLKAAAECYESALDCEGDNEDFLSALCELRLQL